MLGAEALRVIEEEEALLGRVRAVLTEAKQRARLGAAPEEQVETWRALRDQAAESSEDDLPPLLLELGVRHRLLERQGQAAFPDLRSPYLAHLRIREGAQLRDYLLGHLTFIDTRQNVRIVDWRVAPIARIFYRYREGDTFEEELPGRRAEGVVEARRIVVIENGALTRIVGDKLLLSRARGHTDWTQDDRELLALSSGGAGSAARPGVLGLGVGTSGRGAPADITALLDAEQYAAVSAPAEQPLVVLGSAGSGKTTVALHRLARLAAISPTDHPLADMRVVVPEEGLARLSRRLLAPLGAGAAQVQTLDRWAHGLAREVFAMPIKVTDQAPASVFALKRHPALYSALRMRFAALPRKSTTLPRLHRRLTELYTDRGFLGGVVDAAGGELGRATIEDTVRHTMKQLQASPERALASILDEERKQALDGRPIWEGTPDELSGTIDLEDLPILLFLRAWRGDLGFRRIAHLVLDEAEDFSLFELSVMGELIARKKSVTLAGDEAQQTSSSFAGWDTSLAALGVQGARTCRLAVSYRCPQPVVDLARHLLGSMSPEIRARAARAGAPVGYFRFPTGPQANLFVAGALRDLTGREPSAAVAVIAVDEDAAKRFYELVRDLPEARLVLRGEFSFEPGIDVTDVDNAKGLEWDYVIVPDATAAAYPLSNDARRRLHVAVTRTSHQLWLVSGGNPSPLLPAGSVPEPRGA